jgi:AraC family transcriptional regulator of adaptative response / DNA-3-methyladenine glycosylase II
MLPKPFSWDRALARAGRLDGKFVIGVLTTGIYCLPSCGARPPKPENVRLFATEAEARAAGLRPCKRCRPDLFYRGEDGDVALFEGLCVRVRAAPERFSDASDLARACGVSQGKLEDLMRKHGHATPAAWLRRERVRAAGALLLETHERVVEVGHAAGFASESVFHRQFLGLTRMTPGAYRGLDGARVFQLQLPPGYRDREILSYHARDPQSPAEKVHGRRIVKALATPDGPVVLEIQLERGAAWCQLHTEKTLRRDCMRLVHGAALRMLGLRCDVTGFEHRAERDPKMAALVAVRPGLRLPLTPNTFEGLCWAIIGQQINVSFASALRRELLTLAGDEIADMRAHPTPERVAALDAADLARRRYSRSKAEYLTGAARAVAAGTLAPETMSEGSAVAAERSLLGIHGIGKWTARYTLMRGAGFADCAPVGDVALAAALQKLVAANERPDAAEVERLMQPFAPHRSLATCHLWASLKEAA